MVKKLDVKMANERVLEEEKYPFKANGSNWSGLQLKMDQIKKDGINGFKMGAFDFFDA